MTLEIPSRPENIALARVAVSAFLAPLDLLVHELDDIKLAVSEAVTNSVSHAYPGGEGIIRIKARLEDFTLHLWIEDEGRCPPHSEGLGFTLMRECLNELAVTAGETGGTTVYMRKLFPGSKA
ncbi:MAG: ATP-binding protein [Firmicutes bacterium]|nr:ATP-binding protein [Bacillota bacterium]